MTALRTLRHAAAGLAALALGLASLSAAAGDLALQAEAGPVWQTRNDFRIPGDGGDARRAG